MVAGVGMIQLGCIYDVLCIVRVVFVGLLEYLV